MTSEENKALTRRFFEEVWNKGNLTVIDELTSTNIVDHDPLPGQPAGVEGVRQFVQSYRTAFPDLHIKVDDIIAEGDKVVVHWTAMGTNNGPLFGMPKTGKKATTTGITINRIVNGKTVESWTSYDQMRMLQQLGLSPVPQQKEQKQTNR